MAVVSCPMTLEWSVLQDSFVTTGHVSVLTIIILMTASSVMKKSALLDCYCATFDEGKTVTRVGACMYNCNKNMSGDDNVYNSLTRNSSMITCLSFNRAGALCGRCLPEHYPLAYSFNLTCIKCPHVGWNWGRYIMAAYLPLTLFCFFVLFFEINAVTSHLHPVIWCSQAISMSVMSRMLFLHTSLQKLHIYI